MKISLEQLRKSKTVDFNAACAAVFGLLLAFGVEVPAEVVAAVTTIGNFILRFFTNKSLSEK
jgi:hypothetical protein